MAFGIRFVAALVLVLATWNPDGWSFVDWVKDIDEGVTPPKALLGVVLTIGWVAAFTASWRSMGVIGTGLLAALVATSLWTVMDWASPEVNPRLVSYMVLVGIAFVLAVAMSWSMWKEKVMSLFRKDDDAKSA